MLRERGALVAEGEVAPRSNARIVDSAVLVNLLNPKLTIFFFAFVPQFVATWEAGSAWRMLELSAVFMAFTFVVFAAYGLVAASVRTHVISRHRVITWMRRAFAGSFAAPERDSR
jgi:threonine/homoserine/homoserine lactone efflux protein